MIGIEFKTIPFQNHQPDRNGRKETPPRERRIYVSYLPDYEGSFGPPLRFRYQGSEGSQKEQVLSSASCRSLPTYREFSGPCC